jgi:hypothetical protein
MNLDGFEAKGEGRGASNGCPGAAPVAQPEEEGGRTGDDSWAHNQTGDSKNAPNVLLQNSTSTAPIDAPIFVREKKETYSKFIFGKILHNSKYFELKICQYESYSNLSEFYRRPNGLGKN